MLIDNCVTCKVMEPFPSSAQKPPPVHKPMIGEGLSLTCKPPYNYPTGTINWALTEPRQEQQLLSSQSQDTWVTQSDRVTLDYSGGYYLNTRYKVVLIAWTDCLSFRLSSYGARKICYYFNILTV